MQVGSVALVDVLGAKQLTSIEGFLNNLIALKTFATKSVEEYEQMDSIDPQVQIKTLFFSDTIAIVAYAELPDDAVASDEDAVSASTLKKLVPLVSRLLLEGLNMDPVLFYRGCVSNGRITVGADWLLLGNAVNNAAQNYEVAQGAFVWFDPGALRIADSLKSEWSYWPRFFVKWPVPVKGGDQFETLVVNPFSFYKSGSDLYGHAEDVLRRSSRHASVGIDVAVKRQNTRRFFTQAVFELVSPEQ